MGSPLPCQCGAADVRYTDHAYAQGQHLIVHGLHVCYVVKRDSKK